MTRSRPPVGSLVGRLLPALALGLLTGAATSLLQATLPVPWAGLVNAASPWLAVAFLAGALAAPGPGRPALVTAGLAGGAACAGEVAGYYVTAAMKGHPAGVASIGFWLLAGLMAGPVLGALGQVWRCGGWLLRLAAGSALAACFLIEAVRYELVLHYTSRAWLFAAVAVVVLALGGLFPRPSPSVERAEAPVAPS